MAQVIIKKRKKIRQKRKREEEEKVTKGRPDLVDKRCRIHKQYKKKDVLEGSNTLPK